VNVSISAGVKIDVSVGVGDKVGMRSLPFTRLRDLKMTRHPKVGDPGEAAVEVSKKELAMTAKTTHPATTETVDHVFWAGVAPPGPRVPELGLDHLRPLQDGSQVATNRLDLGQLGHADNLRFAGLLG
jgi:hypothetical protein